MLFIDGFTDGKLEKSVGKSFIDGIIDGNDPLVRYMPVIKK